MRWSGGYWLYRFEPSLAERLVFPFQHLWNSLLVTKRRRVKLFWADLAATVVSIATMPVKMPWSTARLAQRRTAIIGYDGIRSDISGHRGHKAQ